MVYFFEDLILYKFPVSMAKPAYSIQRYIRRATEYKYNMKGIMEVQTDSKEYCKVFWLLKDGSCLLCVYTIPRTIQCKVGVEVFNLKIISKHLNPQFYRIQICFSNVLRAQMF